MRAITFLIICCALLSGCAGPTTRGIPLDRELVEAETRRQQEIALKDWLYDEGRIVSLTFHISRVNAELCEGNTGPLTGTRLATDETYKRFGDAPEAVLSMTDQPTVAIVVDGSPAGEAGLKPGDRIKSINGTGIGQGTRGLRAVAAEFGQAGADGLHIVARRGGEDIDFFVEPVTGCAFPGHLTDHDMVNAFADGDNIYITRGMLRFVRDDYELSVVIAHELAHNAMQHIRARTRNAFFGLLFDIAAATQGVDTRGMFTDLASMTYSKEFEAEADYVGMYMLARAGEDVDRAPDFWRRMASANPANIRGSHSASHPSPPERFVTLESVADEIALKLDRDTPLFPEMK